MKITTLLVIAFCAGVGMLLPFAGEIRQAIQENYSASSDAPKWIMVGACGAVFVWAAAMLVVRLVRRRKS